MAASVKDVAAFEVLTYPAVSSLDREVVREVGTIFASYVADQGTQPFAHGLRDALEEVHPSQVLALAAGMSNAAALVMMVLSEDGIGADRLMRGGISTVGRASLVQPGEESLDTRWFEGAQGLIARVFGTAQPEDMPAEINGQVLAAVASLGDAAVRVADDAGVERAMLADVLGRAAL